MRKNNLNLQAIHFDAKNGRFQFGHKEKTIEDIGAALASALLQGEEIVPFRGETHSWCQMNYGVGLSVDYIQEMLRFVARHGWFWDEICERPQNIFRGNNVAYQCDHTFDKRHITPGVYWGEYVRLRKAADELMESSGRHASGKSIGKEFSTIARRMRRAANRLLVKDLPRYSK